MNIGTVPHKCTHPPQTVTADILEGDNDPRGIRWCRICGAYQRYAEASNPATDGMWQEPVLVSLAHERENLYAKLAKAHGVAFRLMEISRNPTPSVLAIRECVETLQSL